MSLSSLACHGSEEEGTSTNAHSALSRLSMLMQIIARNSHTSRQRGLMPSDSEMTTTVSNLPRRFGFTCWHFCYCYLMAPLHLCTEAESQAVLDPSPAVLKGLLNLIPAWWSFSVLAPRFPGESQAGKSNPPPRANPHPLSFSYHVPFFFCAPRLPYMPRGDPVPSSLSVKPDGRLSL